MTERMTAPVTTSMMDIGADALSVREVGPWLQTLVADLGAAEQAALLGRLELAVHEICMNSVDHAGLADGARLTLSGAVHPDAVLVLINDNGLPFDETDVSEPVPGVPQVRGYGLLIVRKLADQLSYTRTAGINEWSVRINRVPAPAGSPDPEEPQE